jgi:CheY-like chemotaxis protein
MEKVNTPRYRLFAIEDNSAQLRLMQEAIIEAGLNEMVDLDYAFNGEEACAYLDALKLSGDHLDLVLTDLNLPRISGKQILKKIKRDEELKYIPVIILTNSGYRQDMIDCYRLGADGYVQKPADFMQLVDFFISVRKSIDVCSKLSICYIEKAYDELKMTG